MNDQIERLKRLDACAVSDALDKLEMPAAVSGIEQRSSTRRIAGRVVTCQLVRTTEVRAPIHPPRHLGTAAIEIAQPGDIIVVEQRTGLDAGSWGGILSLGAKVRGIAGVIADGPVRDIDEARMFDFPIYSRALTARTARGRVVEAHTGDRIIVGEVEVANGDYVIADASGVVFIPSAALERVLDVAESIASREAAMAKALLAGKPITEVMGSDYEHMLV